MRVLAACPVSCDCSSMVEPSVANGKTMGSIPTSRSIFEGIMKNVWLWFRYPLPLIFLAIGALAGAAIATWLFALAPPLIALPFVCGAGWFWGRYLADLIFGIEEKSSDGS